ncbi:FAD-dependent oxidoreductase [Amycolatopsis acidicola]|uniref:FAD-dependent oxidoreductase n=1 Tax=Amycolatopsis acidicola TaxID=2596893 RepID=A0A5N0UYV3_9PSEU|nr:FAD-dependent oxidoreductase [Amycolatopsis acidicola]KAA9156669.1 FAD-dependent oxidoreductase [Amycolatopsis acidicola]
MPGGVVVVGGGYGGTLVAEALDPVADVVLVDPREAFVNVAASLRALTRPDWAHNAFFPYETLLRRGRVVRDRAVSVDATGVTLGGGGRVDADFVVLATGSSYAYPARPRRMDSTVDAALSDLRETHDQLGLADRVLILGAGPVGLELAGEIREVWPGKRVTVVEKNDEILRGFLPEVGQEVRRQLSELDIELRLGAGLTSLPPVPEGQSGAFAVETEGGEEIGADIWFRSFGSRVNTGCLADGRLVDLPSSGLVPVTDSLNVAGHENVYALGDIVDLADPKMATWAQTQAGVVVENLRARLEGRSPDAVYTSATERRILLPLGTTGGAGQLAAPGGTARVVDRETVIERKGRDLFTARFAERFHLESPVFLVD